MKDIDSIDQDVIGEVVLAAQIVQAAREAQEAPEDLKDLAEKAVAEEDLKDTKNHECKQISLTYLYLPLIFLVNPNVLFYLILLLH